MKYLLFTLYITCDVLNNVVYIYYYIYILYYIMLYYILLHYITLHYIIYI